MSYVKSLCIHATAVLRLWEAAAYLCVDLPAQITQFSEDSKNFVAIPNHENLNIK